MNSQSMILISSKMTMLHKRVLPVLVFGLFIIGFSVPFFIKPTRGGPPPPFFMLLVGAPILVFMYLIFRKLIFGLADEVYDCGDHLLVKKGNVADRVMLSNIRNVGYTIMVNPQQLTLSLREPCRLGLEISFMPQRKRPLFQPFGKSPLIDELIDRVDNARLAKK